MPALTREQAIAAAQKATANREPIKFEGLDAFVTEMSAGEADAFGAQQAAASKNGTALVDFRSRFVARCLINEDGDRLFNDGDIGVLSAMPSSKVDPLYKAAVRINAFGEGAKEEEAGK